MTTSPEPAGSRLRRNLVEFLKFGLVGGSGVAVNFVVFVAVKKLAALIWQTAQIEQAPLWTLPGTEMSLRWFSLYSIIAFFVANLWNYILNRNWTFRSDRHAGWWREYWPFLTVGLVSQLLGMLIEIWLNHAYYGLSDEVFDNSVWFLNKANAAHLLMILATVPIQYLVNKFWTFRAIRGSRPASEPEPTTDRLGPQ